MKYFQWVDAKAVQATDWLADVAWNWLDLDRNALTRLVIISWITMVIIQSIIQPPTSWFDWISLGISMFLAAVLLTLHHLGLTALNGVDSLVLRLFFLQSVLAFAILLTIKWNVEGELNFFQSFFFTLYRYLDSTDTASKGPRGGKRKNALSRLRDLLKPRPQPVTTN